MVQKLPGWLPSCFRLFISLIPSTNLLYLFSFFLFWFPLKIVEDYNENGQKQTSLVEIGPRFVLALIRIFGGSFGGPTLFQNRSFVSPNEVRREVRKAESEKSKLAKLRAEKHMVRKSNIKRPEDELGSVFRDSE